MGETKCYASVRGSAIRATGLTPRGSVPDVISYVVSKTVAKVTINEVSESGSSETLGSEQNDNDNRLRLVKPDETIRYTVDIDFLRVDPGVLNLLTGAPITKKNLGPGFGKGEFGLFPFGGPDPAVYGFGGDAFGTDSFGEEATSIPVEDFETTGFDSVSRPLPMSFGLEVWSKLAGVACADGTQQYGYTVFPHLRGGRLGGFAFSNGLVSFNIKGAQTRRGPRWAVGPYDLEGPWERLLEPVSRNTLFRQTLTTAVPPVQANGIQVTEDVIYGGSSTVTTDDVIEGGTSSSTTDWIIYGGQSA